MGAQLDARRRLIASRGRSMTLRRSSGAFGAVTYATVTLTGFSRAYRPDPLAGSLVQADYVVEILNDEIAAQVTYAGPPRPNDELTMDGQSFNVQGAEAIYEASTLIGHRLMVRGGR
jgi:hypothetical protein